MAKCPFTWLEKDCPKSEKECQLWHKVIRCYDNGGQKIEENCVFILDHEERRNQTQRMAMLQAETGEVKNATIFQAAMLAEIPEAKNELFKITKRQMNNQKRIGP
jgi:hypothetical protein